MRILFSLLFIVFNVGASATNYYVSSDGNDANNGTSPSTPWKTIAKFNSFTKLAAGDAVLFSRGDMFYGSIMVNKSGGSRKPIIFGAYGTGTDPVITGFTSVTTWVNLGGNIWESTSSVSSLSTCNMVLINGANTPMGRYPNTSFLAYQSHSGTTSITSSSLTGAPNWTGAELVMRSIQWMLERNPITSQSGATLNYTGGSSAGTNGYGFFIQNDARTLDAQNEWYYNPSTKKIRIYSASIPSNVQLPTIDELVLNSSHNYVTFDNITFDGANSYLFENRNSQYLIIQNCTFLHAGKDAFYINRAVSANDIVTIKNSVVRVCNDHALNFTLLSSRDSILNNNIDSIGMIPGGFATSQDGGNAIELHGPGTVAMYNTITNVGHHGIDMTQTDGLTANYNYISNFGMTRYDAGGIYSWNQDSTITKSRIIDHNIILNSNQKSDGIGTDIPSLFGIYLDGNSKNTFITNNTIAHCYNDGIHILNSGSVSIINNTCYDNGSQLAFTHAFGGGMNVANMVVKNNNFISKLKTQRAFNYRDDSSSFKFGTADSNYYARPIDDSLTIATTVLYTETNRTLSDWQTFSRQDYHSKNTKIPSDLRFEYNTTSLRKTIPLTTIYMDIVGVTYSGFITIDPYTSVLLYKKNQK